jgi:FkbM family methyltransferase
MARLRFTLTPLMKYLSRKKLIFQKKQDSSSLLPIGKMQEQYFTGTEESHTETIEVRSLDDIISDVAGCLLLKIDVQGFELHALKRTKNLL